MNPCLRIRVGSSSLFAGNTVDRIHVVVTHVRPLRSLVLRVQSNRQVLLICCRIIEMRSITSQKISVYIEKREKKEIGASEKQGKKVLT